MLKPKTNNPFTGGTAGGALHAAEGEGGPAAHPVRPSHVRQGQLQGRTQPHVPGSFNVMY